MSSETVRISHKEIAQIDQVLSQVPSDQEDSFGFQNCISLLIRFPLLVFSFRPLSILGALTSIDNLLFSPCELLINRDKLAMLDRLRVAAAENEAER